jgi:L-lysine 6-transaminase
MELAEDVLASIGKYILVDGFDMLIDLEKSHSYYLHDKKHDKTYLDFFSFFASAPLGFNHPSLLNDEKFLKDLKLSGLHKVANSDMYTEQMAHFVNTFGEIAMKSPMKHSFFISGGALAVENTLKAAFDWKVRSNFAKGIEKEVGHQILHFKSAFHGRSGYTLSLTNTADPRKYKYFPKFDWPRVLNPGIVENNLTKTIELERESLKQINSAFDINGDDIAAIIIEPIQCEGGDIHFRHEYLKKLRQVADEREALLIFDEIQTGVGVTGKFWCYEHFKGAEPDLVAFGKKTQICGIMSSDRIDSVEDNVFQESSRINSTFGGVLNDMVRSAKYMEIIKEDNLIKNAEIMGEKILKGLREIAENYEIMTNVRGRGLLAAFSLPDTKTRDNIKKVLFDTYGVIVLTSGHRSIRIRPPLIVDDTAVEQFLSAVDMSIKNFS